MKHFLCQNGMKNLASIQEMLYFFTTSYLSQMIVMNYNECIDGLHEYAIEQLKKKNCVKEFKVCSMTIAKYNFPGKKHEVNNKI